MKLEAEMSLYPLSGKEESLGYCISWHLLNVLVSQELNEIIGFNLIFNIIIHVMLKTIPFTFLVLKKIFELFQIVTHFNQIKGKATQLIHIQWFLQFLCNVLDHEAQVRSSILLTIMPFSVWVMPLIIWVGNRVCMSMNTFFLF
jgi:hypothetical protein